MRSLIARLVASLFALWFAAVLGDPGVLHACPEHGTHAQHGVASAHSTHEMAGGHHDTPPPAGGECTCIGSCCAAPAVAPLPSIATFAVSTAIVPSVELPHVSDDAPAPSTDRLLPFANGPPQG